MWHLLILTAVALPLATATPLASSPETRVGLLCGNYSIDVGQTLFIRSKRYAQDYPKNYECDYTFHCTDYASVLLFNCNNFTLQRSSGCTKDFLQLHDNNLLNSKFCGTKPPQNVTTGGNFLGIKFKTNADLVVASGFFCSVKCFHVDDLTTTATITIPPPTTSSTTSGPTTTTTSTTTVTVPEPASYNGCKCGEVIRKSRIIGGQETLVGEFRWQVALTPPKLKTPYCGGVLVTSRHAITAATCVRNIPAFDILLGEHDWKKVAQVVIRNPASVTMHPVDDIAIIEFDHPVNLNSALPIKPVCLPDNSTDFIGMKATATGWGITSATGFMSPSLQEVEITVASCPIQSPSTLCSVDTGKGACNGDTGGPLVVDVDGSYVLAGITSQANSCARGGKPAVYTSVQNLLSWINLAISDGKMCDDGSATTTGSSSTTTIPTTTSTTAPTTTTTSTTTPTTTSTTAPTSTTSTTAPTSTTTSTTTPTTTTTTPTTTSTTTPTTTTTTTTPTTTTTATTSTTTATTAAPTALPGLLCACGIPVNPTVSTINTLPWTVALINKATGLQYCSGTPINTLWVLTAASCVTGGATTIQVRANAQDLTVAGTLTNRDVVSILTNGDLALIQLAQILSPVNLDGVKPACLPSYSPDFTNKPAMQSGYGAIPPSTTNSNTIKKVNGNIISCSLTSKICFQSSPAPGWCGADKGGPVVSMKPDGRYYLAGIALNDNGCSNISQEAAKVSDYYQWIWTSTQTGRFCSL